SGVGRGVSKVVEPAHRAGKPDDASPSWVRVGHYKQFLTDHRILELADAWAAIPLSAVTSVVYNEPSPASVEIHVGSPQDGQVRYLTPHALLHALILETARREYVARWVASTRDTSTNPAVGR